MRHGEVLYQASGTCASPGATDVRRHRRVRRRARSGCTLLEACSRSPSRSCCSAHCGRSSTHAWVAAFAPLLVLGGYWAGAPAIALTQPEALVGFPLYLAIWGVTAPGRSTTGRMLAAGLAGAAVAILKLIYLPIVGVVCGRRADAARDRGGLHHSYVTARPPSPRRSWRARVLRLGGRAAQDAVDVVRVPVAPRGLDLRDVAPAARRARSSCGKTSCGWCRWRSSVSTAPAPAPRTVRARAPRAGSCSGAVVLALQTWYLYQFLVARRAARRAGGARARPARRLVGRPARRRRDRGARVVTSP